MKRYISTFILLVLVICLVIALGFSLKVVIQKDKDIATLTQENTDLKNTVENLNNTINNLQSSNKEKEEPKNEEITSDNLVLFDESKLENKEENTSVVPRIYATNNILSVSVDNKNKALTLDLNAELARQVYGYAGQNDEHTIAGLNKNIVDVKIVATGNSASGLKVVMLMEDGTVRYISMSSILDKTYAINDIANLNNVVRLYEVTVSTSDEVSSNVVAVRKDGSSSLIKWE